MQQTATTGQGVSLSSQNTYESRRVRPTNPFAPFPMEATEQSIPQRFAQQVATYPHRLAVKTSQHAWTYATLNAMANGVAHTLLAQRGADPEPVVLLMEHAAPVIAAQLGVLKARKFYVPLEPSSPQARLAYMLEDSQARLLLTDSANLSLAQALAPGQVSVLNLETLAPHSSPENPSLPITPDDLACILYTSGSTGQPKGVVGSHRYVLHATMNYTNSLHVSVTDRLALLYFCGFAAGMQVIYTAVLNGASLHPFDPKKEGITTLASWMIADGITIYASVTTLFRHFVGTLTDHGQFPTLRLARIGSELVSPQDVALCQRHFSPDCLFVHTMGTTEASLIATYCVDKETPLSGSTLPIGYPVAGHQVLLLDETGNEVGCHHAGEIVIKSRYLAQGYWRRPDLTQATFLAAPDGGEERLYRTGDLGMRLPDGCLVHLGRKDLQVKVHGHRIDVAEIEQALCNLDVVQEAVVVMRQDHPGEPHLVAYLVPAKYASPTANELQQSLQTTLPNYMVPAIFVLLDTLPLTTTGKVNRQALPAPSQARPAPSAPFTAPRTPIEAEVARLWAEVLGQQHVSIHDPFLALGGHSLLAMQIVARVRDTFQVEIPLPTLFAAHTVAHMAVVIAQYHTETVATDELAQLLTELEEMPEDEAQRRVVDTL